MNAYKLNCISGYFFRETIVRSLNIPFTDVYKVVKNVYHTADKACIVETADGRKFEVVLKEIY